MLLVYIEPFFFFILFQIISLAHREKVSLCFAYPFFSHSKKNPVVKNDNYGKKLQTLVLQQAQ